MKILSEQIFRIFYLCLDFLGECLSALRHSWAQQQLWPCCCRVKHSGETSVCSRSWVRQGWMCSVTLVPLLWICAQVTALLGCLSNQCKATAKPVAEVYPIKSQVMQWKAQWVHLALIRHLLFTRAAVSLCSISGVAKKSHGIYMCVCVYIKKYIHKIHVHIVADTSHSVRFHSWTSQWFPYDLLSIWLERYLVTLEIPSKYRKKLCF